MRFSARATLLAAATRAMDTAAEMARHHKPVSATAKGDRDLVTDLDGEIERAVGADLDAGSHRRDRQPRARPAPVRHLAGPGPRRLTPRLPRRDWASSCLPRKLRAHLGHRPGVRVGALAYRSSAARSAILTASIASALARPARSPTRSFRTEATLSSRTTPATGSLIRTVTRVSGAFPLQL